MDPHKMEANNSATSPEHLEHAIGNLTPSLTTAMKEIELSVRQKSKFHRHWRDIVTEIHWTTKYNWTHRIQNDPRFVKISKFGKPGTISMA